MTLLYTLFRRIKMNDEGCLYDAGEDMLVGNSAATSSDPATVMLMFEGNSEIARKYHDEFALHIEKLRKRAVPEELTSIGSYEELVLSEQDVRDWIASRVEDETLVNKIRNYQWDDPTKL